MHNFSKLIDGGVPFEIVPNTRKITVPTKNRIIGTVGDCLSEQVRFACPMVIDGHDITLCGRKYVSWRNVLNEQGSDELKELDREDGYVLFCWNVPDGVTVGNGVVSFSIHFEDVDDNGNVTYRWGTSSCSDCEILDAVNTVVGTYKSMYVSGDTLVISDYTPVQEQTLELNSESVIPKECLSIVENGIYHVRDYADVNVNVPDLHIGCKNISITIANDYYLEISLFYTRFNETTGELDCIHKYIANGSHEIVDIAWNSVVAIEGSNGIYCSGKSVNGTIGALTCVQAMWLFQASDDLHRIVVSNQ